MTVTQLYHTLQRKIRHLIPTGHAYRARNLAWIMTGIYLSRSVHLSRIANKWPGRAQRESRVQRLRRFLRNASVRVREWYAPVATPLLAAAAQQGEIRLLLDATKVTAHHQLLMVALAYRRRALPIAWTWVRKARGHSSGAKQVALLAYVRQLLPADSQVILVGDSEFTAVQDAAEAWGWGYVLRQKGSHLFQESPDGAWQRLDSLAPKPGRKCWLTQVALTRQHQRICNLLVWWQPGEKKPWLLATNLPSPRQAAQFYSRRMWIEEMFGDFKKNGFDLERSRLRHVMRLSRLTLAVALLYVLVVAFGSATIKRGRRKEVDRSNRRDLSIFRIGYDMLERCFINGQSPSLPTIPYFT